MLKINNLNAKIENKEILKGFSLSFFIEFKVDFLTIGQYLQPSTKHFPLFRYLHPYEFKDLKDIATSKGFLLVSSTPLTRSSYHADDDFKKLKDARTKKLQCHLPQ